MADRERRDRRAERDPDRHQPAAVLGLVMDKPFGRPQEGAVLDRRCARQPHRRAGRDGMAPPGAEPKNITKQEDGMKSDHVSHAHTHPRNQGKSSPALGIFRG